MKSKRANERVTSGKIRFPLEQVGPELGGKEKQKRETKERKEKGGERSSTFSLDLVTIGLSAFVGARGTICPHDEGFA